MKRSEMLSLIENLYSRMLIINGLNAISPHDISNNILTLIEQNDMLPPEHDKMIEGHLCTVNEWESEDV